MEDFPPFVDIHCHLIPGIDDGADDWEESLSMAKMAVADGFETMIMTPHQMGNYGHNQGATIRQLTNEFQQQLRGANIELQVLPGADVRIEDGMIAGLRSGDILSLGDHRRHVLLELPHEIYLPLEPVLSDLAKIHMVGILSHPERNRGLISKRELVRSLVDAGCLMQVTAGSLIGSFGPASQQMAEWMVQEQLVHFLATDAHGLNSRRPRMTRSYQRVAELTRSEYAALICCENPRAVAQGTEVSAISDRLPMRGVRGWFRRRRSA